MCVLRKGFVLAASPAASCLPLRCDSGPHPRREAYCTAGYTPILSFTVPDLQQTLTKLLQLGAHMDGPIQYPTQAKVCGAGPEGV